MRDLDRGSSGRSPPPEHTDLKTILCAIELVPESASLLKFAKEIGLETGAAVRIVHAIPATEVRPDKYFDQPLEVFLQDFAREEIAKLQTEAGTNFSVSVELGVFQRWCTRLRRN